jgi:hypothetical protein
MNDLSFEFPLYHLDCQSRSSPTANAANAKPADVSSANGASFSSQLQSPPRSSSSADDGEISHSNEKSQTPPDFVAALKEWAIVCKAAEEGKQVLLFRKGGIMEYRNGFELKHKHFFLFPTFEHQSMDSIRDEYKEKLVDLDKQQEQQQPIAKDKYNRPNSATKGNSDQNQNFTNIDLFVEITHFSEINDIDKLEKLEKFHIWNNDYVKMRYNYNPKKPLYLMLLRTYKLNDAIKFYNKPEWSGCKSWIQLDIKDKALENCFNNSSSPDFEHLKSISKPCIDDVTFNNLTKELRSII